VTRTASNVTPLLVWILLQAVIPEQLCAQEHVEIEAALRVMQLGDQPKAETLAAPLIQKHPDDPAVLYLQAAITSKASAAIQLYQRIWSDAPASSWADDAVYRLYQYSIAVGAYQTADRYRERLRARWPDSPYLSRTLTASDAVQGTGVSERQQKSLGAGGSTTGFPEGPATQTGGGAVAVNAVGSETSKVIHGEGPAVSTSSLYERYAIQAGIYPARKDARRRESELSDAGYTVEVLQRTSGSAELFCVVIGHFDTEEQARAFRKKLKAQTGIDGKVITR
jgi:hypothetical protein